MPESLDNFQFPVGYGPWYVYSATAKASPTSWHKFDIVKFAAGKIDSAVADEALFGGYAAVLEKYETGKTGYQVAMPGSLVPTVAATALQPGALVKTAVRSGTNENGVEVQAIVVADIAAGKAIGRFRCHYRGRNRLRAAAVGDHILVELGAS